MNKISELYKKEEEKSENNVVKDIPNQDDNDEGGELEKV